jgi:ArsR family transcriptional regulator, virulence genes transcriptional regulator
MDSQTLNVNMRQASGLLKALANERRLLIIACLTSGEMSVGALEKRVGLSQSALSQHLARLRRDRLVATRRSAQTIFYRLNNEAALTLLKTMANLYPQAETSLAAFHSTEEDNPAQARDSQAVIHAKPPRGASKPSTDGPNQPNP